MTQTAKPITHAKPHPATILQTVGDEMVILNLRDGQYYELNATARQICEWLFADRPLLALIQDMTVSLDVTADQLASDIQALLTELSAKGLIDTTPTTPGE